jgi:hypothetical protein
MCVDCGYSLASWTNLKELHLGPVNLHVIWFALQDFRAIPAALLLSGLMTTQNIPHPETGTPYYVQLLSSVTSPLTRISFSFLLYFDHQLDLIDWRSLNALLSTAPTLAHLREVTFELELYSTQLTLERAHARVGELLTGLKKSTRLAVVKSNSD